MDVPGWLLKDEGYRPRADRDGFLDRSILAFLALLARGGAMSGTGSGQGARGGTEPLLKVAAALLLLLLVALSRNPLFLALVGTGLLVLLAGQTGRVIASVLVAAGAAALFTLLILLPALAWGRGPAALMLPVKAGLSVACVRLVAAGTGPAALTGAFKRLGAPDLFLLVFDLALKYIVLLGEFALALLYALRLRSVGRNADKRGALAGVVGSLFLKSMEMAEEMYDGMTCRGFTGQYRAAGRFRPGLRDAALGGAMVLLAAAFVLTRRA